MQHIIDKREKTTKMPIALTRRKRAALAATNAAIQNSLQKDAASKRLGVKKKIYPN